MDHPANFFIAANYRIELAAAGLFSQVAAILVQRWVVYCQRSGRSPFRRRLARAWTASMICEVSTSKPRSSRRPIRSSSTKADQQMLD